MIKAYSFGIYSLLLGLLFIGCAGNQDVNVQGIDSAMSQGSKSEKLNALMLKSAMERKIDPNADYVIGAEDLLEIDTFQAEELKRTVRVSSQGYIGLPLIGQVKAKGLTTQQLEQELTRELEKYIQQPRVSVSVKEFKSQKIAVMGAVANPQVYAVSGQRYLLDLLTMAGGLAKDAGSVCYVLRPSAEKGDSEKRDATKTETIVIDLSELLENGNTASNIPVFGGDVINVTKGGMFFVGGAVNKPGTYQMHGRTTLMEAIFMAEGLKYECNHSDIRILRDKGNGTKETITMNYDDIKDGKQHDVGLRENDIVIASESGPKRAVSWLGKAIRGVFNLGSTGVGIGF